MNKDQCGSVGMSIELLMESLIQCYKEKIWPNVVMKSEIGISDKTDFVDEWTEEIAKWKLLFHYAGLLKDSARCSEMDDIIAKDGKFTITYMGVTVTILDDYKIILTFKKR